METARKYQLIDLFFEAVRIEVRVLMQMSLGLKQFALQIVRLIIRGANDLRQAITRAPVLVFVQLVDVVRGTPALIVDCLGLFLGFEVGTVVGVRRTND